MYAKKEIDTKIQVLEDKIEELEKLLRIRESEITLYRGILEDIGAEIEEAHRRGFQCDNPNKPVLINKNGYARFEISSNHICEQLYKLGFLPRKTYQNTFCLLEKNLMPHYLRGYFDGDGSIGDESILNKNHLLISGYEQNMRKIGEFLLKEKHITSSFNWDKRKKYTEHYDRFGALVFTNKLNKYCFLKYIYADASIYLDRKYEKSMKFIEEIEKEERVSHTDIVNYYKYAVQTA